MTLPGSGLITFANIAGELGRSQTSYISLNDSDVRNLLQVGSGYISMANAYGKSARVLSLTWSSPQVSNAGVSNNQSLQSNDEVDYSFITVTSNGNCVWNYTDNGGSAGAARRSVNRSNGETADSITFEVRYVQGGAGGVLHLGNSGVWNASASYNGQTISFSINIQVSGGE